MQRIKNIKDTVNYYISSDGVVFRRDFVTDEVKALDITYPQHGYASVTIDGGTRHMHTTGIC